MKTFKERHKHKRFSVKNRSIVLVSPTTFLSYTVLDISNSGFAFSYLGCDNWSKRRIKIDILDQKFFLEDISISVIEDFRLDYGLKESRRCGVKFTNLDAAQKARLRQYIARVTAN